MKVDNCIDFLYRHDIDLNDYFTIPLPDNALGNNQYYTIAKDMVSSVHLVDNVTYVLAYDPKPELIETKANPLEVLELIDRNYHSSRREMENPSHISWRLI